MEEAFHESVSRERLRELGARRDGPGLVRLTVQLLLAVGSGAGLVLASQPWEWALALSLQTLAQLSFFATLHECAHKTAFRLGFLNSAGAWIASLCQLVSPPLMRAFHFEHHRHTHDLERDPELAGLEFMARWPRGLFWLANASGLPVLFARLAMTGVCALGAPGLLASRVVPYVRPKQRAGVVASSLALVLVHLGAILAALQLEPRLLRIYLAVPLAHALLSLYIACEHRGLPTDGGILERTRSFDPGPVARWFMWNMPFHAEHHAYPAVPFHALPALHQDLRPQLKHRAGGVFGLHWRRGQSAA